jgi:hypothetical protein
MLHSIQSDSPLASQIKGQWQVFRSCQDIRARSSLLAGNALLGFVAPRGVDAGI